MCTKKQSIGGLSLIDPHDALDCLMSKWIIKAYEPGHSNLLTFLRYRLFFFQPVKTRKWAPDLNWFMAPSHKSALGSKIWNKARKAWKKLCKHIQRIKPTTFEEVASASLWYNPNHNNRLQAAFSRERVSELHRHGLKQIKHVWPLDQLRCLTWPEACARYHFLCAVDEAG